ncbi:MAG: AraC family transcriptional regulator, partial [Spirochaetales bacterium]|nr:AraC family transcriptional regulator [Spirochaetales bacterium]
FVDPGELSVEFGRLRRAFRYRLIAPPGRVLSLVEIEATEKGDRPLTAKELSDFQKAVIEGNGERALEIVDAMFSNLEDVQYFSIETRINRVCYALKQEMNRIDGLGISFDDFSFSEFFNAVRSEDRLDAVIGHIRRCIEVIICGRETIRTDKQILTVRNVQQMIEVHFDDPNLYTAGIADSLGMNPAYLGRLFKRVSGTSINEYIKDVRLEAAAKLLGGGTLTVAAVAEEVGITNAAHFFRLFKEKTGMTPAQFRSTQRTKV